MKCIRALFSVCLFFSCYVAVGVGESSRESSRHRHGQHPSRRGLALRPDVFFFPLENQSKARASRSRASLLNPNGYYTLRDRVVCQYSRTIARGGSMTPHPPTATNNRLWLAASSHTAVVVLYIRETMSVCRYLICKSQNVSPRLQEERTVHGSGSERRWRSRKPTYTRPFVWKDTLLLRSMPSQRHVESRRMWIVGTAFARNNIEQVGIYFLKSERRNIRR